MSPEQPESSEILTWEDDPGEPGSANSPVSHPRPEPDRGPFASRISGEAPPPGEPGSAEFRYWVAAASLRQAADFWGEVCGADATWNENVGDVLPVELDFGEDFNAYYDRVGLKFFHGVVGDHTVYSAESPDVVRHEAGHAILDALQPRLWDAQTAEPPALHEAFGDIASILCSLQLPSLREAILTSTGGRIDSSSRLSRLAEQLGWAIRQGYPQAVEPDCLRNASNYFFYRDPLTLPPSAPATSLSSESHSFSRVFSGGFLSALAGMYLAAGGDGEGTLGQVSLDAGRILVDAARKTPVCVPYFSQFAAHMLAADQERFGGQYGEAIRHGFVRHGVLALTDATAALATTTPAPRASMTASPPTPTPAVQPVALSGEVFGFDEHLVVNAPAASKRFNVSAAAPEGGPVVEPSTEAATVGYVEDIFRRGHVAVPEKIRTGREIAAKKGKGASHEVQRVDDSLVLVRRLFKCGWRGCGE